MDRISPEPRHGFGEHLRVLRRRAGLTQAQLAERCGLTTDAIAAIERGLRRHPYPHTVSVLCAALGLPNEEHRLLISLAARSRAIGPASGIQKSVSNVPSALVPLIGRARELETLHSLLTGSDSRRLVTVVGGGGVGKTALVVRVAPTLAASFPDGVWLIELAPIVDALLVPMAVGSVLGMADAPSRLALEALPAFLASKSLLLVLDNCEHLVDACADLVGRVLAGCPNVRVLATSREPFLIAGEQQLRLAPLRAPEPEAQMTPDYLSRYPAAQLFVERVRTSILRSSSPRTTRPPFRRSAPGWRVSHSLSSWRQPGWHF